MIVRLAQLLTATILRYWHKALITQPAPPWLLWIELKAPAPNLGVLFMLCADPLSWSVVVSTGRVVGLCNKCLCSRSFSPAEFRGPPPKVMLTRWGRTGAAPSQSRASLLLQLPPVLLPWRRLHITISRNSTWETIFQHSFPLLHYWLIMEKCQDKSCRTFFFKWTFGNMLNLKFFLNGCVQKPNELLHFHFIFIV